MKIIVDFDDVLFITSKLKERFFTILAHHGIEGAQERYHFERKDDRPFSLMGFLKRVCEAEGVPDAALVYEEVMEICADCVNKELVETLQAIGSQNCYIVTNGDKEFQEDKLVRSGLYSFPREVIIVPESKKEAVEGLCRQFKDEEILFIDDKEKFFADINREVVPNLKTVQYVNEGGPGKVKALIAECQEAELKKFRPQAESAAPPTPPLR
jgi:FMN phosphatase YigB (HAD superfamily)